RSAPPAPTARPRPRRPPSNEPPPHTGPFPRMTDTASSPAPQTGPAASPAPAPPAAPPRKRVLFSVILGLVAVIGVLLVLWAWRLPPFASGVQHTDNAYVRGQVTLI